MSRFLSAIFVVLAVLGKADAAYCNGNPDAGERTNEVPIWDETAPRFVRSVKNAMLFEAGPPNATFPIVHLWGTPYDIGYAQGKLMRETVVDFV